MNCPLCSKEMVKKDIGEKFFFISKSAEYGQKQKREYRDKQKCHDTVLRLGN